MSHEVETMFSVREVPWHRQGVILDEYPGSWAEARTQAGLDWEPTLEPIFELSHLDRDTAQPVYAPIDGYNRIVRSDTNATLSVRSDSYPVINHVAMGEIVEAVLAAPNVKWETAGVLLGGRSVWCLALLDEPIHLPGDPSPTLPYLGITNRHDGQGACTLRATAVRIVCANTWRASELEGERTRATYQFAHRGNWRQYIEDAKQAVTGARREMREYVALATDLLALPVTPAQREMFVREFIPLPPDGLVSERVMLNVEQARTLLRNILASPTTIDVAHTAYGLVQAGGEYLDHVRTYRTWESRLGRTMLKPEPLKRRALSIARSVATTS